LNGETANTGANRPSVSEHRREEQLT